MTLFSLGNKSCASKAYHVCIYSSLFTVSIKLYFFIFYSFYNIA